MNLEKINELTAQDMAGVNAAILEQLNSDVQLIDVYKRQLVGR